MSDTNNVPGWNIIFDDNEVEAAIEKGKARVKPDPRICACGHNARSHASESLPTSSQYELYSMRQIEQCTPARQTCECKNFDAVVTCDNVRLFIFKTNGAYAEHALTKGIKSAMAKGIRVEPVGEWKCAACGKGATEGVSVGPVPFDEHRREVAHSGWKTVLMCGDCIRDVRLGNLG